MDTKFTEIGSLIQERRQLLGITQAALGQRMGVGRAQISKIESGKGLSFSTIEKVAEALDAEVVVHLKPRTSPTRKVVEYVIASINEFARHYQLTTREASNYLLRFKGIQFLENCYDAEHTLSFADCIEDLTAICRRNGGGLS